MPAIIRRLPCRLRHENASRHCRSRGFPLPHGGRRERDQPPFLRTHSPPPALPPATLLPFSPTPPQVVSRVIEGVSFAIDTADEVRAISVRPIRTPCLPLPPPLPLPSQVVSRVIEGVGFGFYTADEVRAIRTLNLPSPYTPLFPFLLPAATPRPPPSFLPLNRCCVTCQLGYFHCPGHFGHLELALPVYHPLLFSLLVKLLRCVCLRCHHLKLLSAVSKLYALRLALIAQGRLREAQELGQKMPPKAKRRGWGKGNGKGKGGDGELGGVKGGVKAVYVSGPAGAVDDEEEDEEEEEEEEEKTAEEMDIDGSWKTEAEKAAAAAAEAAAAAGEVEEGDVLGEGGGGGEERWSWAAEVAAREVVRELWSVVPPSKCQNCFANNPSVKREGHTEVAAREVVRELWSVVPPSKCQNFFATNPSVKREGHSAAQVAAREVVRELWSVVPPSKCQNCFAINPSVKREGHSKIFRVRLTVWGQGLGYRGWVLQRPLWAKQQQQNDLQGFTFPLPPNSTSPPAIFTFPPHQKPLAVKPQHQNDLNGFTFPDVLAELAEAAASGKDPADISIRPDGELRSYTKPLAVKPQHQNDLNGFTFPDVLAELAEAAASGNDPADINIGPDGELRSYTVDGNGSGEKRMLLRDDDDSDDEMLAAAAAKRKRGKGGGVGEAGTRRPFLMNVAEVEEHLRRLWIREPAICNALFGSSALSSSSHSHPSGRSGHSAFPAGMSQYHHKVYYGQQQGVGQHGQHGGGVGAATWPSAFFLRCLLVPPNKFRPPNLMNDMANLFITQIGREAAAASAAAAAGSAVTGANATTAAAEGEGGGQQLAKLVYTAGVDGGGGAAAEGAEIGATEVRKAAIAWLQLQHHVNCFLDSSLSEWLWEGRLNDKRHTAAAGELGAAVPNETAPSIIPLFPLPHLSIPNLHSTPFAAPVPSLSHLVAGSQKDPANGIRQQLERKEGLFRMNMMGKRVNYACRSVISPDPYIQVCQFVGLVENGADVLPGATHVEDERGQLVSLAHLNPDRRRALARTLLSTPSAAALAANQRATGVHVKDGEGKKGGGEGAAAEGKGMHVRRAMVKCVFRHMRDGDVVLVNRQPTLHRPGIMAHRVKILKGEKTLRLHYANCNVYNADFDGDEMNVHLPQDALGRAEAYSIVDADLQYILPTNGLPARGLIQ
ncbi:unnamed protein product, partial [Closterium sp. NIES-53]